jgi:hypothetical protein
LTTVLLRTSPLLSVVAIVSLAPAPKSTSRVAAAEGVPSERALSVCARTA